MKILNNVWPWKQIRGFESLHAADQNRKLELCEDAAQLRRENGSLQIMVKQREADVELRNQANLELRDTITELKRDKDSLHEVFKEREIYIRLQERTNLELQKEVEELDQNNHSLQAIITEHEAKNATREKHLRKAMQIIAIKGGILG